MQPPIHSELWRLAKDVHAVRIGAELVVLDVEADRYLCLPDVGEAVSLEAHGRALQVRDAALAQDLRAAGLIEGLCAPGEPLEAWPETPPHPTRSAVRDAYPRVRWADAARIARAVADILVDYRGRSFAQVLHAARQHRPPGARDLSRPALGAIVEDFHRWIPYAPLSGKCLLRSFLLLRLLQREGLDARWVFGVATWPFRAHCWLQVGELVLDERLDRLAAFTPILVV